MLEFMFINFCINVFLHFWVPRKIIQYLRWLFSIVLEVNTGIKRFRDKVHVLCMQLYHVAYLSQKITIHYIMTILQITQSLLN